MYGTLPTASTFARFYPVIMGLSTHSMKACLIKPHLDERNACRKPTIDSRDHCLLISTQSTQSTPDCLYPDFGLVKASAIHRSNRRFAEDHCFPFHCVAGALGALGAGAWPCPPILSGGLDSFFRNPKKNQKEAEKCAFPGCYIVRCYFPTKFPGFQPLTFFELLLLRQGEGQVWVEHSDFSLQTPLISRGITKQCWKQMVTGSNPARSLGNGNLYSSKSHHVSRLNGNLPHELHIFTSAFVHSFTPLGLQESELRLKFGSRSESWKLGDFQNGCHGPWKNP